jgi:hypothetical protein
VELALKRDLHLQNMLDAVLFRSPEHLRSPAAAVTARATSERTRRRLLPRFLVNVLRRRRRTLTTMQPVGEEATGDGMPESDQALLRAERLQQFVQVSDRLLKRLENQFETCQ